MDIFSFLTLFGGLAFFLYGMNVMSSGLEKLAGGKLEVILQKITSNKWKSLLFGIGITAAVQSSSAVTVMLVGLVNSGIMQLGQTIGILMGSNIGTTLTVWLLALSGISGESVFLKLIKPESFSPLLALIGIIMIMTAKHNKTKDIGRILVGFSVLFTGMMMMGESVEPLKDSPSFSHILTAFNNPLVGVLAGAVITAVIQSSAASIGILQSLSITGHITYGMAIPIIMGQNIGTCVTALLSAVGANKNAKRAAMIHLYFNLIGTAVFMSVFYIINAAVHFPFMTQMATPAIIAITHSIFNITATLVWLPFSDLLVKLACLTIRDTEEEQVSTDDQEFLILESRFLEKPAFAVEQGRNAARRMEQDSRKALRIALDLVYNYTDDGAKCVEKMESKVDRYEDELGTYLVKLNNKDLSERDSHSVSMMLHCIGDFERISDHAVNIMESAQELHDKKISFSLEARNELQVLISAVDRIVDTAYQIFDKKDLNLVNDVEPLEEIVDELSKEMKRRHINRLRSGECTIEMGFILTDLITSLERIADHCSNISVCVTQIKENLYDTHSHLNAIKNEADQVYIHRLDEFREEYVLP